MNNDSGGDLKPRYTPEQIEQIRQRNDTIERGYFDMGLIDVLPLCRIAARRVDRSFHLDNRPLQTVLFSFIDRGKLDVQVCEMCGKIQRTFWFVPAIEADAICQTLIEAHRIRWEPERQQLQADELEVKDRAEFQAMIRRACLGEADVT